ncbi:glycosyltransferase family 2 protein [Aneurinibacillus danicus]|uniref:Glycosyltransferase 2-like domain-containing protein n=1 Tax=Aneurinibacillus danicus TaxID=267746 RepID=A0A511V8F2_9BACL|nr:glycosyltransferase family 2 protein [Aneurinibacillus danicus]GEN35150.1 hypothetical protein ADA01nite_26100 [Aneurinibacillus danicus]
MKNFILLPCFNEEKALPLLLERIKGLFNESNFTYEVVIVNDGSKDNTLSVAKHYAKTMPIHIIDHGTNQGLGVAMRNGLEYTAKVSSSEDVVIALDADNTHDPALIESMVQKIKTEKLDVVIASRYAKGAFL